MPYHPRDARERLGRGDRTPDAVRHTLLSGSGDFYGGSVGIELSNEHRLADDEPVDSLVFSTVFALRYAFSDGEFGRAVVDPGAISAMEEPFQEGPGRLRIHEIGFYVGSGLHF